MDGETGSKFSVTSFPELHTLKDWVYSMWTNYISILKLILLIRIAYRFFEDLSLKEVSLK